MNRDVLVLDDVSVSYPGFGAAALGHCSLRLGMGEKVALLGLNGSGKTTFLLACAGLVAFEGAIRVDGILVERRSLSDVRRRLGFLFSVPDDQLLMPRVLDDVAIALARDGASAGSGMARARAMLESLGGGDLSERSPYELSHGQKQLVALAGALVADPPLLLLDEPSAGLDPPARIRLGRLLASLPAAVVLATHDIAFARRCCPEYVMLDGGRLVRRSADYGAVIEEWEKDEARRS